LDDPGRFEIAAWLALTEIGMTPYQAANLVTFLLASDRPITTESIDGILLKSSTSHRTTVKGHADRVRRKSPEAIARADKHELAWLTHSSGLILALLKFTAEDNAEGTAATLDLLRDAGWTDTLLRIARRVAASLQGNFPPAEGPLSRAAARLLRETQQRAE
jgi:hypothetical protein